MASGGQPGRTTLPHAQAASHPLTIDWCSDSIMLKTIVVVLGRNGAY